MPTHYPSNYYDMPLGTSYNNVVTRRLAIKDWVGFAPSQRFGGQPYEQKAVPVPYHGTIIDAVGAVQQLINELNLSSPYLPDLGLPVILSTVGVATNQLQAANGVAVSYVGAVTTAANLASFLTFDGVSISTGLRVLYYGLTTAALNGVYVCNFGTNINSIGTSVLYLQRASDLTNWWQFAKPKTYLALNGTVNKANTFSLQTDGWEQGNTFQIALGTQAVTNSVSGVLGTSITMQLTNYSPGIGTTTTSAIYPPFNFAIQAAGGLESGEYDFLANMDSTEFIYIKNRAHRLAYRFYKMRENFSPQTSSYGSNIVTAIGAANTVNNIGFSTFNDLPKGSRYPSSFNRGW